MIKKASFNWRIKLKLLFKCVSFRVMEETGKKQVFSSDVQYVEADTWFYHI